MHRIGLGLLVRRSEDTLDHVTHIREIETRARAGIVSPLFE